MTSPEAESSEQIMLSSYTQSILTELKNIHASDSPSRGEVIDVSETASFFAFVYEKVRNAVEFSEEHLIRRLAISRIVKRRLSVNPKGTGEGLNVVRELLWGRYLPEGSATKHDADGVQKILDICLELRHTAVDVGRMRNSASLSDFITDLTSCEIEEYLQKAQTQRHQAQLFFLYQTTHQKVSIDGITPETKDQYYFAACETAFSKNDTAFIRYHLFVLQYGTLAQLTEPEIRKIAENFRSIFAEIDRIINNAYSERLTRFVKKQLPPFRILYELIRKEPEPTMLLSSPEKLWERTVGVCEEKYRETAQKLRVAAIRSIIYIFATKMLLVLLLEVPLTSLLYKNLHILPLALNTLLPPFLMGVIVTFINPPRSTNTRRIYERIIQIIDADESFEKEVELSLGSKKKIRRPVLWAAFTLMYSGIFIITFSFLYLALDFLGFNIISKAIFVFFISVVTFFGYRIRQIAKEYTLSVQQGIFSPFVDALILPVLSVGKVLSNELAKLNILMYFFDVLIEAPFKLIVEVVEEWISYAKQRKEEIG